MRGVFTRLWLLQFSLTESQASEKRADQRPKTSSEANRRLG